MAGVTSVRSIRFAELRDPVEANFLEDTARDIQRELDTLDGLKTAAMKRPVAIVHTNSFSVAVTTPTAIQFTNEDIDTHNMVDLAANNTRITVSTESGAGIYYVVAHTSAFNSGSWTLGELSLSKNGSGGNVRKKYYNHAGSTSLRMQISALLWLGTVGDYVDLRLYHEGGGTDNISVTYMKAMKVTTN